MLKCHSHMSSKAVSSASPECLIVVDSEKANIEVLFSGKWMSVPSYGRSAFGRNQLTLHSGSLYVSSGIIHCCTIESLLANSTLTAEDHGNKFWKTIPLPPRIQHINGSFVMLSFEQHLLAFCPGLTYVYTPNTQSWVFIDDNLLTESELEEDTVGDHIFKTTNDLYHLMQGNSRYIMSLTVKDKSCFIFPYMQCLLIILTVSSARVLSLDWRQQESLY